MDGDCPPTVRTLTLTLDLARFDPAFSQPLVASLVLLGPQCVLVSVGAPPHPYAFARDASVALPRPPPAPAAATTLGPASTSTALSGRLAKRYQAQVFLTLDLTVLAEGTGGPAAAERAVVPMEKALVAALDEVLPRPEKA